MGSPDLSVLPVPTALLVLMVLPVLTDSQIPAGFLSLGQEVPDQSL